MAEKRIKVKLPGGDFEGSEVGVTEVTERWSEILLEDGSRLRVKPNIMGALRVDGQFDPEGNPIYALKSAPVMMIVSAPLHLRKGATSGKAN